MTDNLGATGSDHHRRHHRRQRRPRRRCHGRQLRIGDRAGDASPSARPPRPTPTASSSPAAGTSATAARSAPLANPTKTYRLAGQLRRHPDRHRRQRRRGRRPRSTSSVLTVNQAADRGRQRHAALRQGPARRDVQLGRLGRPRRHDHRLQLGLRRRLAASTDANPTHIYVDPGPYTATLTVTDNRSLPGARDRARRRWPINATEFNVAAHRRRRGRPRPRARSRCPVTFSSAGSGDSDGTIVTYEWNFGDGSARQHRRQPDAHVRRSPATYIATLTVTDNDGATAHGARRRSHRVLNIFPSAAAAATPTSGKGPLAGRPSARPAPIDTDGTIASYAWDFETDGIVDSTDPNPSHVFAPGQLHRHADRHRRQRRQRLEDRRHRLQLRTCCPAASANADVSARQRPARGGVQLGRLDRPRRHHHRLQLELR